MQELVRRHYSSEHNLCSENLSFILKFLFNECSTPIRGNYNTNLIAVPVDVTRSIDLEFFCTGHFMYEII